MSYVWLIAAVCSCWPGNVARRLGRSSLRCSCEPFGTGADSAASETTPWISLLELKLAVEADCSVKLEPCGVVEDKSWGLMTLAAVFGVLVESLPGFVSG